MSTTFRLCSALIAAGKTEGLADKLDVFFAAGRLTAEEYSELVSRINTEEEADA